MTKRTAPITRNNMLENLFRIRRELEAESLDHDECRRLLDEALHVMHWQQQSRKEAHRAATEAATAAGSLIVQRG